MTLIINNWQAGSADSPHIGFGVMKNVDIESFPGSVMAGKAPASLFAANYSSVFTAATTDVCTADATVPLTNRAVTVSSTGTLPAGLSSSTIYYVININSTTFKLATSIANAEASTAVDITDTGSGTHTVVSVNPGTVNHFTSDCNGVVFMQDSNGRIWFVEGSTAYLVGGNTLTNSAGNGIAIFKNSDASATYLFAFRNASIDVVNITGRSNFTAPSWTNAWNALNSGSGSGNSHHAILAQDNIIYFCDDRYVGSIKENAGQIFAPGTPATYTYNNQSLDLPGGEVAQWLEELGTDLLIAGNTWNKIYPWDRTSDSFRLPLHVPETSVKRLKNIGNKVYILSGLKGNIYETQGTYITHSKKLPDHIINNSATVIANPITWGGIWSANGALLFGISGQTSGNDGVYKLTPDGVLTLDNQPSTGSGRVTAIYGTTDFYYMGYASGADYSTTSRYSSYQGIVHSELYRVGTKTNKTTYSTIEIQIAKPASSGHIRVSYRTDASSSFTTIGTYTADGVTTSFNTDVGLIDLENIQFQVEIDGSMELVEIRFFS